MEGPERSFPHFGLWTVFLFRDIITKNGLLKPTCSLLEKVQKTWHVSAHGCMTHRGQAWQLAVREHTVCAGGRCPRRPWGPPAGPGCALTCAPGLAVQVRIALQLDDGSRLQDTFCCGQTLWELLSHFAQTR